MKIKWFGHACFLITSDSGIRLLTDPFDESIGYKQPDTNADIVTVSHGHYDHNNARIVNGDYELLDRVGNFNIKDIPILGLATYHDEVQGAKRGNNVVYIYEIDGFRICHLGDLGHILTEKQVELIGQIDILMIPIGGVYTIDSEAARHVVNEINPLIILPMHYRTPALKFELGGIDSFLKGYDHVIKESREELEINKKMIEGIKQAVVVLNYE